MRVFSALIHDEKWTGKRPSESVPSTLQFTTDNSALGQTF